MGFLPCISIIAESRIIDKIYLISWLQEVLFQLLFQSLYFLRAPIFQSSYTFPQVLLFQQIMFIGAATLFIYHLVINPGVFRYKFPGVHIVVHHTKNHSIKYYEQKFCIKFAFQGSNEQDYLLKHVKNLFLGCQ